MLPSNLQKYVDFPSFIMFKNVYLLTASSTIHGGRVNTLYNVLKRKDNGGHIIKGEERGKEPKTKQIGENANTLMQP